MGPAPVKSGFGSSSPRFSSPTMIADNTRTRRSDRQNPPPHRGGAGPQGRNGPTPIDRPQDPPGQHGDRVANQESQEVQQMDVDPTDGHQEPPAVPSGRDASSNGPLGAANGAHHDGPPIQGHPRGTADEEQAQDVQATLSTVIAANEDLHHRNEELRAEIETLRQHLGEAQRAEAFMRGQRDEEHSKRMAMEEKFREFVQQHVKPPSSETQAPLLYAFAGNTSAAKYTALVEHVVQVAVDKRDTTGLLAPFSADTPSSLSQASVLLYVMCISTSRLDEACREYMDYSLLQHAAAQGCRVVLLVLRSGGHIAPINLSAGDRVYEVVELNIDSDPTRQTRVFRPEGNLSRTNLPTLRGLVEPVVQKWSNQRSIWGYITHTLGRGGGSSRR